MSKPNNPYVARANRAIRGARVKACEHDFQPEPGTGIGRKTFRGGNVLECTKCGLKKQGERADGKEA